MAEECLGTIDELCADLILAACCWQWMSIPMFSAAKATKLPKLVERYQMTEASIRLVHLPARLQVLHGPLREVLNRHAMNLSSACPATLEKISIDREGP